MKNKKIVMLLVLILSCSVMVWAGGTQEGSAEGAGVEAAAGSGPLTVVDFLGRTVTLDKPAQRLAFSHYSTPEALKILDAWDMVVAKDGYSNDAVLYPGIGDVPSLGQPMDGPYTLNMEVLLEASPDLLILEVIPMPGMEELIKNLEGVVPVITVQTYDPYNIKQSLTNLGVLLNRTQQAEDFIAWYDETSNMLLEKTGNLSESEKTTLFYKSGWGSPEDLTTFSDEISYMVPRNKYAGCINVAADLPSQGGWVPQVDPEWLVSAEYDVLVIGDPVPIYGSAVVSNEAMKKYRDVVMNLPVFTESKAVKNGKVYLFCPDFFGTPRHLIGFAYLAKWCHPELFADMDPKVLHQGYIDRFLKVDLNLDKQGFFVYPEY